MSDLDYGLPTRPTGFSGKPTNTNLAVPQNFQFEIKKLPTFSYFVQSIILNDMGGAPIEGDFMLGPKLKLPAATARIGSFTANFLVSEDFKNYFEILKWMKEGTPYRDFSEVLPLREVWHEAVLMYLTNKKNPFRKVTLYGIFPTELSGFEFSYMDTEVKPLMATIKFAVNDYKLENLSDEAPRKTIIPVVPITPPPFFDGSPYNTTTVDEPYSYKTEIENRIVALNADLETPISYYNENESSVFRYYNRELFNEEWPPWQQRAYYRQNAYNNSSVLSGLNLTGVPISYRANYEYSDGEFFELDYFGSGALITPKHLVHTNHGDYFPRIGQVIRFLNTSNTIIQATVTKRTALSGADMALVEFEEDVDDSITPVKILIQYGVTPNYPHPVISIKPNQKSIILGCNRVQTTVSDFVTKIPSRFSPVYYPQFFDNWASGDSGSARFVIYKNSANTITEPLLVGLEASGNTSTGLDFGPAFGVNLSKIQNQITAWGNTDSKYRLQVFYNKYTAENTSNFTEAGEVVTGDELDPPDKPGV